MKIKRIWDLYQHLIMACFYIIEVDDNTKVPKKALIKKVIIWEQAKIIQENIEVTLYKYAIIRC